MKLSEIKSEDQKVEAIQLARRWSKRKLLSEDDALALAKAHTPRLGQQPLVLRIIQFVGLFLAGIAFVAAFTMFIEPHTPGKSDRYLSIAFLLGGLVAGTIALTVMRKGYYAAGVDEGAWGVTIVCVGLAFMMLVDSNEERAFVFGGMLTAIVPAVFGYFLSSLIVWCGASWLIIDLAGLRVFAVSQAIFLFLLISTESMFTWRRRERQIGSLVVISGASCTMACNRFLPKLFGLELSEWWLHLNPLPREGSIWILVLLTAGFLWAGFGRLDRRLVDVGLFSMTVTLLTLIHVHIDWPHDVSMIVVGLVLIMVSFFARRKLSGHTTGLTLTSPPVVVPRGWTLEDAQGAATWLKEVSSGIRDDRKLKNGGTDK